MVCNIAGLYINFEYEYDLIRELCDKYIIEEYDHIDLYLSNLNMNKFLLGNRVEVAETLSFLEDLANKLIDYNKVVVHGASIEYRNKAYLFMAPSGTGKSTHIKYWKKCLDDVHIINGDKPIIDIDGYVYGSPWSGKERWDAPVSYKLDSVIFIKRDTYNHIEKVDCKDCLLELLNSVYLSNDKKSKSLKIVNDVFTKVDIYKMYCINDISAAKLCIEEVVK